MNRRRLFQALSLSFGLLLAASILTPQGGAQDGIQFEMPRDDVKKKAAKPQKIAEDGERSAVPPSVSFSRNEAGTRYFAPQCRHAARHSRRRRAPGAPARLQPGDDRGGRR